MFHNRMRHILSIESSELLKLFLSGLVQVIN